MATIFARVVRALTATVALVALGGTLAVALATPLGAQETAQREALAASLQALKAAGEAPALPDAATFSFGDLVLVAKARSASSVAVANGTLTVRGTIAGDAVAWHGDVVIEDGGVVEGRAIAIGGKVRLNGGQVNGEVRSLGGDFAPTADAAPALGAGAEVTHALSLAAAWLAVLVFVGVGILVVASPNLDAVTDALEQGVGRAVMTGIAGELAIVPAIVVLSLGLILTVLGILLVPFAVVAYVIVVAGVFALGYLAVARVVGGALVRAAANAGANDRERRAVALRALIAGLIVLMSPWFLAAALAWHPMAHLVAQTVALAISWVAATAGLGAALLSRGGVRRRTPAAAAQAMSAASWQTPTPVAGVVAARRPTPYGNQAQK